MLNPIMKYYLFYKVLLNGPFLLVKITFSDGTVYNMSFDRSLSNCIVNNQLKEFISDNPNFI